MVFWYPPSAYLTYILSWILQVQWRFFTHQLLLGLHQVMMRPDDLCGQISDLFGTNLSCCGFDASLSPTNGTRSKQMWHQVNDVWLVDVVYLAPQKGLFGVVSTEQEVTVAWSFRDGVVLAHLGIDLFISCDRLYTIQTATNELSKQLSCINGFVDADIACGGEIHILICVGLECIEKSPLHARYSFSVFVFFQCLWIDFKHLQQGGKEN